MGEGKKEREEKREKKEKKEEKSLLAPEVFGAYNCLMFFPAAVTRGYALGST